jgi:DNA-binding NarL/FixJ family response regulator
MDTRRVLIVGDTLFAENLAQMLAQDETIQVVGTVPSLMEAVAALKANRPDTVLVAGVDRLPESALSDLLSVHPEVSIICSDLSANDIQVVVNQRVNVHSTGDLLAVISALPRRG